MLVRLSSLEQLTLAQQLGIDIGQKRDGILDLCGRRYEVTYCGKDRAVAVSPSQSATAFAEVEEATRIAEIFNAIVPFSAIKFEKEKVEELLSLENVKVNRYLPCLYRITHSWDVARSFDFHDVVCHELKYGRVRLGAYIEEVGFIIPGFERVLRREELAPAPGIRFDFGGIGYAGYPPDMREWLRNEDLFRGGRIFRMIREILPTARLTICAFDKLVTWLIRNDRDVSQNIDELWDAAFLGHDVFKGSALLREFQGFVLKQAENSVDTYERLSDRQRVEYIIWLIECGKIDLLATPSVIKNAVGKSIYANILLACQNFTGDIISSVSRFAERLEHLTTKDFDKVLHGLLHLWLVDPRLDSMELACGIRYQLMARILKRTRESNITEDLKTLCQSYDLLGEMLNAGGNLQLEEFYAWKATRVTRGVDEHYISNKCVVFGDVFCRKWSSVENFWQEPTFPLFCTRGDSICAVFITERIYDLLINGRNALGHCLCVLKNHEGDWENTHFSVEMLTALPDLVAQVQGRMSQWAFEEIARTLGIPSEYAAQILHAFAATDSGRIDWTSPEHQQAWIDLSEQLCRFETERYGSETSEDALPTFSVGVRQKLAKVANLYMGDDTLGVAHFFAMWARNFTALSSAAFFGRIGDCPMGLRIISAAFVDLACVFAPNVYRDRGFGWSSTLLGREDEECASALATRMDAEIDALVYAEHRGVLSACRLGEFF